MVRRDTDLSQVGLGSFTPTTLFLIGGDMGGLTECDSPILPSDSLGAGIRNLPHMPCLPENGGQTKNLSFSVLVLQVTRSALDIVQLIVVELRARATWQVWQGLGKVGQSWHSGMI